MLNKDQISAFLLQRGFYIESENSKTVLFQSNETQTDVYIKVETKTQPLVIHPENETQFSRLCSIDGVVCNTPMRFYHNSTMRAFPERWNTGAQPTKYGLAFGFVSNSALDEFFGHLSDPAQSGLVPDLDEIRSMPLEATEKSNLTKARIGQGRFRSDLIEEFRGCCALTRISTPELLKASHIKPWSHCNSATERLDPANGILLAANVDTLFDEGFITFDEDGQLRASPQLKQGYLEKFGLSANARLTRPIGKSRAGYLNYHREVVYRS